ncbi:MAG: L-threonylcarbamoyladenylate synthase [Gaiellaceae bacterium]|nr:L-threonylcarbamoyladenylate synthase [Gaiellaceae bacterium]
MGGDIERVIEAVATGQPVLLPTDTVYGLVTSAEREDYATRVYRLKGRDTTQPTALLAASVDQLLECVPELQGRSDVIVRALLPGPYTLILPNPAQRFRWLTGVRTEAIGLRVPELPEAARRVVEAAGCVLATSANDPGGPNPVTLDDVPQRIREGCAAELDLGPLPGTPSTVIDFSRDEPFVIREGAAPAADAIARVQSALVD